MVALLGARDGLLRHRDRVRHLGLLELHAHVQAGQQLALGVRDLGAQRDLARGRVDREVGEQQLAVLPVVGAVFEHHADARGFFAAGTLVLAGGHGAAQLEHVGGRLREVHVQRVDLLHHGQLGGVALADQCAFGDQRAADAARDGRGDIGVALVDLGGLQQRAVGGHVGVGRLGGGHGRRVFLLAHGVGFDQRLVAVGQCLGLHGVGFGAGQGGLGVLRGGHQRCRVDAEQQLAGLHVAAFAELALEQDARRAGAHLGDARGFEAAGQLGHEAHVGGLDRHHADFRRRTGATAARTGRGLALAAGGQEQEGDEGHGRETRRKRQGRLTRDMQKRHVIPLMRRREMARLRERSVNQHGQVGHPRSALVYIHSWMYSDSHAMAPRYAKGVRFTNQETWWHVVRRKKHWRRGIDCSMPRNCCFRRKVFRRPRCSRSRSRPARPGAPSTGTSRTRPICSTP
ncbi:hypothetical protein FQZ97_767750 [compost metagenome]